MRQDIAIWLSVFKELEHETSGGTVEPHKLTDSELNNIKPVPTWWLDFAPQMFRVVSPKEHLKLRDAIAYYSTLQGYQALAMQHVAANNDKERRALSKLQNELPDLTQDQINERLEKYESWVQQNR